MIKNQEIFENNNQEGMLLREINQKQLEVKEDEFF